MDSLRIFPGCFFGGKIWICIDNGAKGWVNYEDSEMIVQNCDFKKKHVCLFYICVLVLQAKKGEKETEKKNRTCQKKQNETE